MSENQESQRVLSAETTCYEGAWEQEGIGKFVVQYQKLQSKHWYDDPYFHKHWTIEQPTKELSKHKNPSVRYRIVFRKTVQQQISL